MHAVDRYAIDSTLQVPLQNVGNGRAQFRGLFAQRPDFDVEQVQSGFPIWKSLMANAYWITCYREIKDPAKLAAYAKLGGPALEAAGGRFLARATAAQAYENGLLERTVIIEFSSVEQAMAAHDSPAYQAALAALDGGAVRDLRIVPGI